MKGWGGQYMALGGSYERTFQDFLFRLAESKTSATLAVESKWDKVLATWPAPTAGETARLTAVKNALPSAKAADGKAILPEPLDDARPGRDTYLRGTPAVITCERAEAAK